MPPKKLTKADRNKQKQEEAERLAREEEERRLKEEEEQREREEQERKEREERERLAAEEARRLEEESGEYDKIRDNLLGRIEDHKMKCFEQYEWQHYISCSPLPLVSDNRALNTFISIYKEQQPATTLDQSLDRLRDLYKLIGDVEQGEKKKNGLFYNPKYRELLALVSKELDQTTLSLMECSEDNIDPETFNLIVEGSIPGLLDYCLWGNIVKDPRLKNFTFKFRSFNLELPKTMLLADVAVRIICSSHDILSPLSNSYHHSTVPSTATGSILDPGDDKELEQLTREEIGGEEVGGDGGRDPAIQGASHQSSPKGLITEDPPQSVEGTEEESQDRVDKEDEGKNEVDGSEGANETEVNAEQEEKPTGEAAAPELEEDEVDLRCYRPAGGVMDIGLFTLPPQPKAVQQWTLKQVIADGLKSCPHPFDSSGARTPISITMSLPEHYFFLDHGSMQLAMWDEERLKWITNGLQDVSIDLEERSISFKMLHFAPLAIMSEMYVNFPYQSWEVLPVGMNHTYVHVTGGCLDVTISVEKDVCTVIRPSEETIVENILNKPMSFQELLKALSNIGYNFFPEPDADKYAALTNKSEELANSVYESMAMSCGGWAFRWSKFNSNCAERNKVILSSAECSSDHWKGLLEEYPDLEKVEWRNLLCVREKSYVLAVKEDAEEFVDNIKDGEETHKNLNTLLSKLSNPSTNDLVTGTDPVHIHTVEMWLKAIKPLSSTC